MTQLLERERLHERIANLIERLADGRRDDHARDALLSDLVDYQLRYVPPYTRLAQARGRHPRAPLDDVPALPTDVFRHVRVCSLTSERDVRVFRSSGTTAAERSTHSFADLSLYDLAARSAARYALFADRPRTTLVVLAPDDRELADSSLSYMLTRFVQWFGTERSVYVLRNGTLDFELLTRTLEACITAAEPMALLGTSFAFVHALDGLASRRFALSPGSFVMQTGGYKGRSREVDAAELRAALAERFGVPQARVVSEYGMTELSSQAYELGLLDPPRAQAPGPRCLWFPGWVRASVVDPQTLHTLPHGELGILRVDDAANLDSVACIQTSDFARASEHGIELVGRDPSAVPRGCSISTDQALASHR